MNSNLIIGLTVGIFAVAFGLVYKGIDLTNPPHSVEYRNVPKDDYQSSAVVDEWSEDNKTGGKKHKKKSRKTRKCTKKSKKSRK